MITSEMKIGEIVAVLATGGLRIVSVTSLRGGEFVVRLRVDPAHVVDPAMTHAEGRGATIAEAIEDAREGWVRFSSYRRERALAQVAGLVGVATEACDERAHRDADDGDGDQHLQQGETVVAPHTRALIALRTSCTRPRASASSR